MNTPTFAHRIAAVANDEPIESIVIRDFYYWDDKDPNPRVPIGVPLTWEVAKPHLSYPYKSDHRGPHCHSIMAWTKSKVIFVEEYDGTTNITYVPRNPPTN